MTERSLQLRLEFQENAVADEVSAVTAVVRPVLTGVLYALKREVVNEAGGHEGVKLFMLPRLRRPGDGDIGICFEYAVHDALNRADQLVTERVVDGLRRCNLHADTPASILFGAEKAGALTLIDTAKELLTPESVLLYGTKGRPVKLKRHVDSVAAAFRRPDVRAALPLSISGLWKADLFTGDRTSDKWIGTSLKINPTSLEAARGLRLGIVPADQGGSDAVHKDESRNLVICPLPYDRSFMQIFYLAWEVVVQFLAADARVPREANLPRPPSRQVARYLQDRRDFAVIEVIDALAPLSQPELLRTEEQLATVVDTRPVEKGTTSSLLAPMPQPGR